MAHLKGFPLENFRVFKKFISFCNRKEQDVETYSVQILNPKAVRLLQDLADLDLITLRQEVFAANAGDRLSIIDDEKVKAREAVMRGSPNMDLEAMLDHLRESCQDRKLPFRDDE